MIPFAIRRARPGDEAMLWPWRNDPLTRQMERDDRLVPLQEFGDHFRKMLQEEHRCILIAEHEASGIGIGQTKFTLYPDRTAVIGVYLNPEFRGLGLASPFIAQSAEIARAGFHPVPDYEETPDIVLLIRRYDG